MKKIIVALMILVIAFNTSSSALAGSPPAATPSPTPTSTSPQTPQQQLDALEAQRKTAIEERTAEQAKREAAQKELSELQQRRTEVPDAQKAAIDQQIKAKEESIQSMDKDLKTRNERINDLDKQVENNTAYKISQINKKYEDLQAATSKSADEIIKKQTSCSVEAGTSVEGQNFCQEYYNLQLEANELYQSFLEARKQVELAQADPARKEDDVSKLQDAADDIGDAVSAKIAEITQIEIKRNQQATFDVSNIFTLNEPSPDGSNRRSIQSVVNTIADWLITLVSSLAVTALIIGGFIMIISGGDENRLEMGKTIFIYSLIGLTVTLISYGLITFIQSLFYPG